MTTFKYTITNTFATEGSSLSFMVYRSGPLTQASTVYLSTGSGTSTNGVDFEAKTRQPLTFAIGEAAKTFTVPTFMDSLFDDTESMILGLYTGALDTSYQAYGMGYIWNVLPTQASIQTLVPSYSVANATADEGGRLVFTISRSGVTSSASTVYLNTDSGTATKGIDFASSALRAFSFAAGETTKVFTIATYADSLSESTETMKLNLFNGSTGTGLLTSGTGTIYNVAPAPSYSVSNAVANEGGTLSFTINRSGTTSSASTVYLNTDSGTATNGIDFVSRTMQSLNFAAGETTKTFTVTTFPDFQSESLESMKLSLYTDASGSGNPTSGTGYIYNVTTIPSYSISKASASEGGNLNFKIYRNNAYDISSTVYLDTNSGTATQGADFVSKGLQSLTFSRGEFFKNFTVATYADSLTEGNETMSLNLYVYSDSGYPSRWNPGPDIPGFPISSPTGLQATGTGTIYDVKSAPPIYSVEKAFAYEGDILNFTIYRSGSTDSISTVYLDTSSGTATSGSDFASVSMQALTFAPGETAKTFGIETYRDTLSEGTESMNLVLYMGSSADTLLTSAIGIIS